MISRILIEKIRVVRAMEEKKDSMTIHPANDVVSVELTMDYAKKQILINPSGSGKDAFIFQCSTQHPKNLDMWIAVADAIKDAVALAKLKLEAEKLEEEKTRNM